MIQCLLCFFSRCFFLKKAQKVFFVTLFYFINFLVKFFTNGSLYCWILRNNSAPFNTYGIKSPWWVLFLLFYRYSNALPKRSDTLQRRQLDRKKFCFAILVTSTKDNTTNRQIHLILKKLKIDPPTNDWSQPVKKWSKKKLCTGQIRNWAETASVWDS